MNQLISGTQNIYMPHCWKVITGKCEDGWGGGGGIFAKGTVIITY
jgi:hypothetical protein